MAALESLPNTCARLDVQLNLGLYPNVGSRLDDKYSVTRVETKVAWYSLCVRCSRGGVSGDDGCN